MATTEATIPQGSIVLTTYNGSIDTSVIFSSATASIKVKCPYNQVFVIVQNSTTGVSSGSCVVDGDWWLMPVLLGSFILVALLVLLFVYSCEHDVCTTKKRGKDKRRLA